MVYTVITLLLLLLGGVTLLPRFKHIVKNYETGINFFLTIVATLVGVFLAISISNFESEQKEKQDVIKLLRAAIASVETSLDYSQKLESYYKTLPKDSELLETFYDKNPLPFPGYIETFLTQNIVSRNLSEPSLTELNELIINLKRTRASDTEIYIRLLDLSQKTLQAEIELQQGKINPVQLEQHLDELGQKLTI